MYIVLRLTTSITALATLAACGGGSSGDSFESRVGRAEAQLERVVDMSPTGRANMPLVGSATFNGNAGLSIGEDIAILGDARLTANFQSETMTGSISNMQGASGNNPVTGVNGTITIGGRESVVGDDFDDNRTNAHNEWYADYLGTLQFEGDRYVVEGALDGLFMGNRVNVGPGQSTVRGILGVDEFGYASVNGSREEVPVALVVFGEN